MKLEERMNEMIEKAQNILMAKYESMKKSDSL
jgi:hypothetical protein